MVFARACAVSVYGGLVWRCVLDSRLLSQDISSEHRLAQLESKGLSVQVYMHLMSPAVGWLFQMAGKGASKELFADLFSEYLEHCNNTMVLRHIIQV